MEIKEATIEDAAIILQIQKEAFISEAKLHHDFTIPPLVQTLDELKADFKHKTMMKVMIDGEIVATGQVNQIKKTSYIGRMSVKPAFQGQGIGSQLLSVLESVFTSATVELFTGVNSLANLNMYSHRGYKEFKRERLGKTTIVFMHKQLDT